MKLSVEIEENEIQLTFDNKLSLQNKFLLEKYNLSNSKNLKNNIFKGIFKNIDLEKLIDSFKKQNFEIILSQNVQKEVSNQQKKLENFTNKTAELKKIKKEIKSSDYVNFCNSLKFLKRDLKDHQLKSLYHLYNAGCAANFSVPGSGKTSVVLAYYEKLRLEGKVNAIFVIGPTNCYHSWKDEFELNLGRNSNLTIFDDRYKPSKRKNIYENLLKSELYASHFQTIKNDNALLKDFFLNNKFLLVVDEAHNIKKIGGTWSDAALNLSKISNYKIILTGTPMPNDFTDFYNYLEFLFGDNSIISNYEKALLQKNMNDNELDKVSSFLGERLFPYYTRVTKKELNLSKTIFNKPTIVNMNPIEDKIYKAIITKIKYYPIEKYQSNIDIIKKIRKARIIRLRQCCSYIKNLNTIIPEENNFQDNLFSESEIVKLITNYDKNEKPAKLIKLKSMVLDLIETNKKVLIWSTHLKTIDLIMDELTNLNIFAKKITGSTEVDERSRIKNEFNNNDSNLKIIVANPQACSGSISLHKCCHNAIYYDINYNTAEFLQSLDRIHRVGGSENEPVYYDFLHYEKSIDEEIFKRVFEKADRQMQVIESDNLNFSLPDDDDFDNLYEELTK